MLLLTELEFILEDNKDPCFIVNGEKLGILYCNKEMEKLLLGQKPQSGRVFYDVIFDPNIKNDMLKQKILAGETFTLEIQEPRLNKKFSMTIRPLKAGNENYLLVRYKLTNQGEEDSFDFELKMANRFYGYQCDTNKKIEILLHLLGESYGADCAYFHEINQKDKTIKLRNSWLKTTEIDPSKYLIEDIEDIAGFDGLMLWAQGRNEFGIWSCDIERTEVPHYALDKIALAMFHRKNLLLCGFEDKGGELTGVVSIADCDSLNVDYVLLKTITEQINSILK